MLGLGFSALHPEGQNGRSGGEITRVHPKVHSPLCSAVAAPYTQRASQPSPGFSTVRVKACVYLMESWAILTIKKSLI